MRRERAGEVRRGDEFGGHELFLCVCLSEGERERRTGECDVVSGCLRLSPFSLPSSLPLTFLPLLFRITSTLCPTYQGLFQEMTPAQVSAHEEDVRIALSPRGRMS
jgi:hypothetical protein